MRTCTKLLLNSIIDALLLARQCISFYADGKLYPLQNFGVKCMSMGFLMKVTILTNQFNRMK